MSAAHDQRAQPIRVFDVFVLGPLMIWVGAKCREGVPAWARWSLMLFGATTVAYNAHHFHRARRRAQQRALEQAARARALAAE